MSRTESSPEEVAGRAPQSAAVSDQAAAAAKLSAKLAAYAVATVAFTFMLLRPRHSNKRGSLFLGSGVVMVLIKTLLSTSTTSEAPASPARAPAVPTLSAATNVVAQAQPRPVAPPRKRPANVATVSQPKQAEAAAAPATPQAAATSMLGPRFADKSAGYSVQFPDGWSLNAVSDNACWVLDATDGHAGLISVGFSKCPPTLTVDQIAPDKRTRSLQSRAGTVVQASGYATIAGRRCLWHKYTGPVSRPEGNPRMTVVHYLLPLQDGRALEVRLAATPEKFNEMAPRMRQSVESFKLLTPAADTASAWAR